MSKNDYSWKSLFDFNKGQKIGLVILLLIVVLSILSYVFLPKFIDIKNVYSGNDSLQKQANILKASLVEKEKQYLNSQKKWNDWGKKEWDKKDYYKPRPEENYSLFDFDPNSADSLTLTKLGIKKYVVKNILKYRLKGGKFKTNEAFSKVYGMEKEKYDELKPYIKIEIAENKIDSTAKPKYPQKIVKTTEPIEINSADTTQLQKLVGVGKYTAASIVYYRAKLGGFLRPEQLKEVRGITPENYEKMVKFVKIDTTKITKIEINKASVSQLKRHPYINFFTKAKAIYDLRRQKIKLKSIEDLEELQELSPDELKRLEPYLSFK